MINYIKKDEEFLGIIKLQTREEIIAKVLVSDEDEETSLVLISDPVVAESFRKKFEDEEGEKEVIGVNFKKWMQFSDAEFFVLKEEDIITIAPVSSEMAHYYAVFQVQESDIDADEVEAKNVEGYKGKISSFKQKLENIFKL
jgi:hypothetical protein